MSSIRLFILSSFDASGPMHGHQLRLEAERRHVTLWTNISVGAVYGAMNRLAAEGLLVCEGREREGKRPARQIFAITEAGRSELARLREAMLREIGFRFDPFDLALTCCDSTLADDLPAILTTRLAGLETRLAETQKIIAQALPYVTVAKKWALRHSEHRLTGEIAFLKAVIAESGLIQQQILSDARGKEQR